MLLPSDDLRYGYRLIIDRQNALPLDLTVMDGAGEPVSRIMFTRLELIGEVEATTDTADAPDMQTPALASTRSVAESETPMTTAAQENGVEDASSWEFKRCPPWRAKRRRVVPGSREATRDTRRAEGAKGDPKGASERGVQSYGRPVC
ncbi:MAG: hypothetical protein DSZ00_06290, partial [Gammaproteobacteria bacterium]